MHIRVLAASALVPPIRDEIDRLCERAYNQDLRPLLDTFADPVHIVGIVDGAIVSHALWITRWLQSDDGPLLRTAYVEAVATDPAHRGRGYASRVVQALIRRVRDFELAALCPADEAEALYARLGWERWRGPLSIRQNDARIATPDEIVMIYRLAQSPPLDLASSLSAEWRTGELW